MRLINHNSRLTNFRKTANWQSFFIVAIMDVTTNVITGALWEI